jgi:hypothetical protein
MVKRMADSGFQGAADACQSTLTDLLNWEHRFNVAMIRGEGPFQTLWSRNGEKA